jgi:hypothetical protein
MNQRWPVATALTRAGDACANVLAAQARSSLAAGLKSAEEQVRAAEAGVQRES